LYFLSCYNPAHRHESPFGNNRWIQQLLDKVSRAVRAVNPECVLTTEAPVDFYSQWLHGALHLTWTIGRELPAMRIALPDYRPFNYQMVGPIYGSLSGFPGGSDAYGGKAEFRALDENWRAMRHGVAATLLRGEVADHDPEPSLPDVTCRLFHGTGHSVAVCARVKDTSAWNFPKEIRLARDRTPFTVRLKDMRRPAETAVLYNLETATTGPITVRQEGGDQVFEVTGTNWFMAVLRSPGGPALGSIAPVAALHSGESRTVELALLGPARNNASVRATLSARGLSFAGGETRVPVTVPGKAVLTVPQDTAPGHYQIQLDGPGLIGMKRFVVVEPE
jgi:hypothetical protein